MPLPPNASYALHGQSRPGDPIHSKPKSAVLLRLSSEALGVFDSYPPNALPPVEFVVGDNPGLQIGDSFFPLQSQKEDICHELYLRSAVSTRQVPLKLHANVTGKLTIQERELDPELQARIHKRSADVAEQRSVSKTKFIDTPPDLPTTNGKKKKVPSGSMFRKPVKASDQPKSTASAASSRPLPVRPNPSPSQPSHAQPQDSGGVPLRKRLIHYIAVAERTTDDTLRAVGGANCDSSTRQDILEAMHQVAEQISSAKSSQRIWRLKPEAWLDVRPYEWPKLSDADRTSLARAARLSLKSLNIPESDPAWTHVKYRPPTNALPSRTDSPAPAPSSVPAQSTSAPVPKRGVSSAEAKGKKARKNDPKAEIMIKDESKPRPSTITSSGVTSAKAGKVPPPPPIASSSSSKSSTASNARLSPAARKPPGSGFKLNKAADPPRVETKGAEPSHAGARDNDVQMKDGTRVKARKEEKQSLATSSESRARKGDRLSSTANGRGLSDDKPPPPVMNRVKHLREESMDSDRERGRSGSRDREKAMERPSSSSHESTRHSDVSPLKRKKAKQESDLDYEAGSSRVSVTKRRKTEEVAERIAPINKSTRESSRPSKPVRDLQLPKKPQTTSVNVELKKEFSPLPSIKKEPSPLPPPISASSSKNSTAKSGSRRRRSPIYTSSEDEGEIQSNPRSVPLLTPPTIIPSSLDSRHSNSRSTTHGTGLPTDHAGLRTRYTSSYVKYLDSFQTLLTQKGEIERLLEREASLSASDGDVELLDYEGLTKVVGENKKRWEELQSIQQAFRMGRAD